MRLVCVVVAGLMVAAGAQAQQSTPAQLSKQQAEVPQGTQQFLQKQLEEAEFRLEYGDCPGIKLSARRQSPGGTMWTVSREDSASGEAIAKRAGEGVHVELKSAKDGLREIELSVSYVAPGARVMTVAPDAKDVREKTFDVSTGGETDVDRDLLVGPTFEITQVRLISATFADGKTWRAASKDACSVVPSKFLPVEAK